ncbi:putative mediator of RNA polymerase II transcription subunit 26 [Saccostrea cucullata]|uniref:putative mediator of RNA polymerase II transcription subunit 26 n=1 Tax=Saccostrea cuccullata TaxID=36930 RepID=UPI002ED1E0DE
MIFLRSYIFPVGWEAVHCQWGLSFGWFWGNLEDLKSSTVEAGVVKSSSYIPGSKTETNLFDDSDSSSSEEDSVAIVSSIVDQQKRRRANHRSGRRGSKRPGKGKRLRKYGRRNKNYQNSQGRIKNFRKSQQRQRQIQKLRKKYNDHIRKKYGKKALKSVGMDSKQWAQNENATGEKYPSKSLQKEQTSFLEEIVNPSSSHQSPSKASPDHENTPSAKQSSKSNIQGIKSNTNKMSIKSSQKINVQTPATNKQEVEHENETTDAPEAEDKSTIPTTTTADMTTQESEYEQDYFGFMDLFGLDQDVYNFPSFPEGQSTDNFNNNNNNFSPESSVGSQPAGSDKPKAGVGRGLNTQASPLKSNDVTMQELEKSPQSILSATANKTEGENFHKSGGIKMKESNLDSISTVVKEPALQARTDLQTKKGKPSGNLSLKQKSSYGTSQNKQTVSIPIEAEKRFLKNKYKLPTVSDPAKNDKSFNLHVDHPQAWKSYDIINPKPNILKPFKSNEQQQGLASVTGKTTHEQAPINMETSKNILSNRGTFHTNTNSDHQQVNNNLITGNKESRIRSNTVGKLPGSNVVETNNLNVNKNVQQYSNRKSITANNLSRVHQMGKTLDSQRIGNNLNNKENKKVQTKPGDNIVNGKNGKKINALFPSTVRKSTTWKPNFSSKIEKTWVDAFLPDKSTAKISNQQPSRDPSKNASNSPMYRGKVAPKKIDSLFSLSQTASQGKNVQLNRLEKHAVISKPIISPEIYPSGSKGRKITPSLSKPAGTVSFKENAPNTEKDNSLKKRPISTLSHMPTSVTAIPSDISKSSWDGSINDRMSYKYKNSQAKTNKMDMNLSQLTSNIESRQQVKPSFTKTLSAKNITNPPKPLNLPYPNVPDNKFKTGVNSVSKFPGKGQSQPPKPPNIISEGFPSRVKKQSSTKTDTEVDIYPDIPSQGNVHIKLPEIPTRLTKELGQREMTNSHQKSPPEPPIVLDQIEVPTNSVFSYSNSSNDENRLSLSSASIDGRLANINRPPPPAKKLQLTLLETEQKPDSKMVAPNSAGLSHSRRAQSKMIQAQNIQLIPYSNAIPMKQALKGGNKQNEMRKLSQIETKSYFGRKRYDKPTRDHGFSSMQSNMIEKQSRIPTRSNLHHKSYNPDNFRINSAEKIISEFKEIHTAQ